jgi:hypothetical protein
VWYLERALGVDALRVRVAPAVVDQALVDVATVEAVARKALSALALVRALNWTSKGKNHIKKRKHFEIFIFKYYSSANK